MSESVQLEKISGKEEQMKRLCAVMTVHADKKEKEKFSFKTVQSAFHQRLQEVKAFEERRSYLSHLCNHLSDTVQGITNEFYMLDIVVRSQLFSSVQQKTGLPQLKEELQKDFSKEKVNTLCVHEGQEVKVICFQSTRNLSAFAVEFYIMTQKHTSDLFAAEWKAAMDAAVQSSAGATYALTLAHISSKVWKPAFRNCQSLLQELHDHSMKLARIDVCFKQHEHDLEMQLTNLFVGVNACLCETNKSGAWIRGVVRRIRIYWHLCNYRKAASAFLDLKEALNLQGDFTDVEKLAAEVRSEG